MVQYGKMKGDDKMTSERVLRRWRAEALKAKERNELTISIYEGNAANLARAYITLNERILRLTQELLDQHLIRKQ